MTRVEQPAERSRDVHDLIIVGAGPAGLSAAIYARRSLLSTLLVERKSPGGLLNETDLIENYPGFAEAIRATELTQQMTRQAQRLGARIVSDNVERIEPQVDTIRIRGDADVYVGRTAILATGSRPIKLPAAGAARLLGKGVSTCATCDGFFFRDARLLVVGAGDSGLTEALFLTRFARSVGIVVRHPEDDPKALRAAPTLQLRAHREPKIHFVWNATIEEVFGDAKVDGVVLRDLASGELRKMPIDGVFVSIGHVPATDCFRGDVALDEFGYILTDERRATNIPGVFAAGDVRAGVRDYAQAIVAAGDGAIAAIEAEKYLTRGSLH